MYVYTHVSYFVVFVAPFCFPSQHHRCCDLRRQVPTFRSRLCVGSFLRWELFFFASYFMSVIFLFSRFSVIVLLRGEAFRCVQQIWSNSNFESSKYPVGSGSGPASSVFKNCKFSFFSFFFFFVCRKFRFDSKFPSSKQSVYVVFLFVLLCSRITLVRSFFLLQGSLVIVSRWGSLWGCFCVVLRGLNSSFIFWGGTL